MRAPIPASLFLLLLASATAQAGGIYQWKDAKGVTHYTDTPPADSQYKQRNIYQSEPDQPATTAAKPADNASCATARQNIALLGSSQNLQLDSDGDGKPDKALTAEDRASQLALAQATVNVSCNTTAPSSPAPVSKGG